MNTTIVASENTEVWFEMSQGEGHKMYTLWRCVQNKFNCNRRFVKNLGIDHDESFKKATTLATKAGFELIDDSLDSLRNIVRGEDVMRFGKYIDKRISELPNGYLLWVAQGGQVPASNEDRYKYGEDISSYMIGLESTLAKLAQKECEVRGLYVEFEGSLQPKNLVEWILRKRENDAISQFVGTIGEKISVEVVFESVKHFETHWGLSSLNIFRTTDGSVIKYFGNDLRGSFNSEELFNLETGEAVDINNKMVKKMVEMRDMKDATEEQKTEIITKIKEYADLRLDFGLMILPNNGEEIQYFGYRGLEEPRYDFTIGETFILKATVKNHDEYRGCKQTQVQRPKLSKL